MAPTVHDDIRASSVDFSLEFVCSGVVIDVSSSSWWMDVIDVWWMLHDVLIGVEEKEGNFSFRKDVMMTSPKIVDAIRRGDWSKQSLQSLF